MTGETHTGSVAIKAVPHNDESGISEIAAIHIELLHFGPFAALGERFVRDICYQKEAQEGVLTLAICEVDHEPAGFIAYTSLPFVFHQSIMRKHWLLASFAAARAILSRPSRILKLPRIMRTIRARVADEQRDEPDLGEIVCVAVRPEFLKSAVTRRIGMRIPEELLRYAARDLFENKDIRRLRMIVDAENKHALFMYHSLGARFERLVWAGEDKTDVYFDLHDDAAIMGAR